MNVTKNLGLLTRVHVKKVSEGNRLRPAVQQPFDRYIHCVYKQHPEHSQKMLPDHLQSYLDYSVLILPFESEVLLCKSSCISSSSSSSSDLII